jgi:predicted aconitase with swiveling domain
MMEIHADKVVVDGECNGPILQLAEPLSFWGGFDSSTGTITDVHHPQCGERITGTVLVLRGTRGSTSSTGDLVEAIHLGNGPAGIILGQPDLTVVTAVLMAAELYDDKIPLLLIDPSKWSALHTAADVSIAKGAVTVGVAPE